MLTRQLLLVKFETDTLPPILNALTTENNGQKLVLEVAVSVGEILLVFNGLNSMIATSWRECCSDNCYGW